MDDGGKSKERTKEHCINSGHKLNKELQEKLEALKSGAKPPEDEPVPKKFDDEGCHGYFLKIDEQTQEHELKDSATFKVMCDKLKIDKSTPLRRTRVWSCKSKPVYDYLKNTDDDPPYLPNGMALVAENFFSDDGIIVVGNKNMNTANQTPGDLRIEHWSHLFIQVIKKVYSAESSVPDFRFILSDHIVNADTKRRIDDAHLAANMQSGKVTLDSLNEADKDTFNSILGSANGVGVAYLLKDYPKTFRMKKITSIHIWKLKDIGERVGEWRYALAFELGSS
ncbi:hypothetical protein HYFRA_00013476 [Hymenoscyphus fraxineus]|uniref:Uncharacterized protein n=1 Tax=Hymenoscyphus fraxineus TaxID=746836 RepID=A0A9N9LAU8_9HELO|nr:hypothetical protein HYFRA_00013476 [Hymenoscyphus fraxineus]